MVESQATVYGKALEDFERTFEQLQPRTGPGQSRERYRAGDRKRSSLTTYRVQVSYPNGAHRKNTPPFTANR